MESSLSSKNRVRSTAGVGVNPTFSSKKFKKLQLLDRKISKLTDTLYLRKICNPKQYEKDLIKLETLDQKRKEVRLTKSKK